MNLVTFLSALSPAGGLALLAATALKGALVFLLALVITGLMRRASAAARHTVWTLALGAALVLPILFVMLPGWQVPVLPGPSPSTFAVAPVAPTAPVAPVAPVAPAALAPPVFSAPPSPRGAPAPRPDVRVHVFESEAGPTIFERHVLRPVAEASRGLPAAVQQAKRVVVNAVPPSLQNWQVWVLLVWAVGAGALVLRWFFAVVGAWRLVREAEPVYDLGWQEMKERIAYGLDLDQNVRLLRSDRLGVPVAGGIFDPVVVLPADADTWPEERREVVLTHELAHIVRRDCLTQTLAQWAVALHWFNPLAWLAHRRYLLEREHACDDYVLNHGTRASDYAEHLLQIARRFRRETLALHATAPMARKSNLEDRITSILNPERRRAALGRAAFVATSLVALAFVLPLAAFQPVEKVAEQRDVQYAAFSLSPAKVFAERLPTTLVAGDEDFEWEGRVASGGFVEVRGINGAIRARTGSGDRVRVEARKTSKRGEENRVEIVVQEFANGIVVCAVYPGQRGECAPGEDMDGNIDNNDVTVTFDVTIPENVRFVGHTVNGDVKTETLGRDVEVRTVNGSIRTASRGGDVEAQTVNGSVEAEATGLVHAQTVNGSINARLGRTDWSGDMTFHTVNGSITLDLPASVSTTVEARTQTGSIHSDFPITVRRTGHVGSEAEGAIGAGERHLKLQVLNGSIHLQRASGSFGSRVDRGRVDRDQRQIERNQRQVEREQQRLERDQRRVERRAREIEEHARRVEQDFEKNFDMDAEREHRDIVARALANIGPAMEVAMAEAGRALAEIDFEREIGDALADVDWDEMEREVEIALEEAEREMEQWEEEMARWDEECDEEHEHETEHDGR